jgi:hypothetical protein
MTTLLRGTRLSTVALLIAFIGVATLWLLVRPESTPTPRTVVGVGVVITPTTGTPPNPASTTPATAATSTPAVPATSARPTRSSAVSVTPTVASPVAQPSTTTASP